jgi:23S rRNA (cytosine1962-C5)-methyltransferase
MSTRWRYHGPQFESPLLVLAMTTAQLIGMTRTNFQKGFHRSMASITLKPGRDKSLRRHHPWVFSGAVAKCQGAPGNGETVDIRAADGAWLGLGAFSPRSQIRARVWSFTPDQSPDEAFFRARISRAMALRRDLETQTSACRLVNAESDGLPGLVVDRYGDYLVCQFLSAGVQRWKAQVVSALADCFPASGIYERSDAEVRGKEGLDPETGVLSGQAPPERIRIQEQEVSFLVDVYRGHKTGFYLDQRDNRIRLSKQARDAEVLNCFSYTGGFGLFALKGGARHVTNVEASADALALGRENAAINGYGPDRIRDIQGDVFQVLRGFRENLRRFDLIVMDPPKFAESAGQLQRAARGYKDINLLAFRLLRPGGCLFTFSCSGHMVPDLFQKIIADAALDAGCEAQIIGRLNQSADHPVALPFPESHYLKGLICRVG